MVLGKAGISAGVSAGEVDMGRDEYFDDRVVSHGDNVRRKSGDVFARSIDFCACICGCLLLVTATYLPIVCTGGTENGLEL